MEEIKGEVVCFMFRKKSIIPLAVLFIGLTINPPFTLASEELIVGTDSVQPVWTYISSFANSFIESDLYPQR